MGRAADIRKSVQSGLSSYNRDEEEKRRRIQEAQNRYNEYAAEVEEAERQRALASSISNAGIQGRAINPTNGLPNRMPTNASNGLVNAQNIYGNNMRNRLFDRTNYERNIMPELENKKVGIDTPETREAKAIYDSLSDSNKKMVDNYARNRRNISGAPDNFNAIKEANPGWDDAQVEKITNAANTLLDAKDKGSVLTPTEQVIYSSNKIKELSDEERDLLNKAVEGSRDKNIGISTAKAPSLSTQALRGLENDQTEKVFTGSQSIAEARDGLKELGWDDKKIDEYLDYASRVGNSEAQKILNDSYKINDSMPDWYKKYKAIENTGREVFNSPSKGFSGLVANLEKHPSGLGVDVNSPFRSAGNAAEYGTQQVLENVITDKHPIGQKAYQIGLSTAESALNVMTLGQLSEPLALAAFGAQAYNSGYKEAKERGATDKQAQLYGIAAGAAEVGTEKLSLDHLWSMAKGTKVGKNLMIDWLAQAGIEGSEEAASDLANRVSDYMIMGRDGKSEFSINVQNYMDNGMSRKEAIMNAEKDFWKGVLEDAVGGFVSGGVMGAGGVIAGINNANVNKQRSESIINNFNNRLMDQNYDENVTQEKAQRYAENPTQYIADNISEDTEETRQAKQNIQEYADKVDNGERLTASDRNDIEQNIATAQDAYSRYIEEISHNANEDIETIHDRSVQAAEEDIIKQYEGDQKGYIDKKSKEYSEDVAKLFTELFDQHKDEVNAGQFGDAFDRFYDLGKANVGFEDALNERNKLYSDFIGEETARQIYEAGYNEVKNNSLSEIEKTIKADPNVGMVGKLTDNTSEGLTEDEKAGLDLLVKKYNLNFNIVDELEGGSRANYSLKEVTITLTKNNIASVHHELGHFAEDFAPAEYNQLKQDLLKFYVENVGSNSFAKQYRNHVKKYGNINPSEITTEMVNSMLVGIMNTDEGKKAYKESLVNDYTPSKAQKIVNAIKDFFDRAYNALMNMFDNSYMSVIERNSYRADMKAQKKIIDEYISTLQTAIDNRNAQAGKSAIEDATKNSLGLNEGFADKVFGTTEIMHIEKIADEYRKDNTTLVKNKKGSCIIKVSSSSSGSTNARVLVAKISDHYIDSQYIYDIDPEGKGLLHNSINTVADQIEYYEKKGLKRESIREIIENINGEGCIRIHNSNDYKTNEEYDIRKQTKKSREINRDNKNIQDRAGNSEKSFYSLNVDIKQGMTDEQRYEALKDKSIHIVSSVKTGNVSEQELDSLKEMQLSKAQVSAKKLAARLGIIKEHENPQLDFTINFSGNNVDISSSHQAKVKMPDKMYKFGEMLTCFDDVVKNAMLLEVHSEDEYHNRKPNHKINRSIDKTYVMFSAFNDREGIVPVKLSVFKMKDNNVNPIHMAITLPTIKKAEVSEVDYQKNDPHISLSAFDYNVSDLLKEIKSNPNAEELGEYIPDQFLNKNDTKNSLDVDNEGNSLSEGQQEYFKDAKTVDENGNLKVLYHGTGRADRVGYFFDPTRAASGPMAFFTDNKTIAENYSKDKADTSISRDERYDSYYTQFRVNVDGKDMSIGDYWNELPARKRAEIREKAPHVTFDDDYEEIIYDESKQNGLGNFDKYLLNEHKNNYLEALVDAWLEQGDLYDQEERFQEVLHLVGIDNAEYLDPNFRDEKVYETYINITNPFKAVEAGEDFVKDFEEWWNNVDQSQYGLDMYSADMWDKSNMSIESWIDRVRNDIENGTTHAWTVIPDAVTDFLKEEGYDGIEDLGGKGGGQGHTVYIPFYSNQIKDITNTNPSALDDIRYSMDVDWGFDVLDDMLFGDEETVETYTSASSILEEGMEALKGQEVDRKNINKVATKIMNEYGSVIQHKMFADQLEKVFAYMQTNDHVNYNDMMRILNEVARPMIDQSTMKIGEEAYKDFTNAMKGYTIKLNDTQIEEVKNVFGSYGNFTRAMMPIRFSKEGSSLDSIWSEIVDATGGILDMDIQDADQPLALFDTFNAIKPTVENNFVGNAEDVSKDAAMRIIEEYLNTQSDAKSQKALKEIKAKTREYEKDLRDQYRKRYDEVRASMAKMDKIRTDAYKENLAYLKAKNKRDAQKTKERQELKHEKEMVGKEVKRLLKWIEKPTEQHHVPTEMVEPILEFMNALDFVEPNIKQNRDGKWSIRVYTHTLESDGRKIPQYQTIEADTREEALRRYNMAVGVGAGSVGARTWVDKMNQMKDLLNRAQNEETFDNTELGEFIQNLNPTLGTVFTDMLTRNKNVAKVSQLSKDDFKILKVTLKSIMHAIDTRNKAVAQKGEINVWAQSTIDRSRNVKITPHTETYNSIMKNLTIDMLTPDTFFEFQGDGGKAVMKGLNNGFDIRNKDIKRAGEYMQDVLKDVDDKTFDKWRGNKAEIFTFTVHDGTITLTRAQIMSLYVLNKRKQAVIHYEGGVKADTIKIKGKEITQVDAVHLTPLDIAKIVGILTDEEKKVADDIQKFLASECSKWGNEASKKMYGYEMFMDQDYFPIATDSNTNATTNSSITKDTLNGIERSGFTKNVNEYAKNAIMIKDIFDVFEKHVQDMAAYHGYAPAIKDANRWFNYKTIFDVDEENNFRTDISVKQAISNNLGRADSAGADYFINLIKDINGKERSRELTSVFDKFVSGYKASAIGANIRVVVQQPTAYLRALNEINPKYLLSPSTLSKSMPGVASKNIDRIKEISPTVWWKSQGYYETSLGRSMDEIITGKIGTRDKIIEASMYLAGKADDMTWSALYTAVEKEQKDLLKGQNLSDEEFTQKVNERFNDVIAKTQVVDATLQKSQWMRTGTKWSSLKTAFMAEPTKSYNMAVKAIMDDYQKNGKNVAKWNTTRKAIGVLVLTDIANSMVQSLVDGMRYHDDDDPYYETVFEYFKKNFIDNINPLNKIPVVKELSESLINMIKGETNNSSGTLDEAAISAVVNGVKAIGQKISGKYNKTDYAFYMDEARMLSTITGIPVYNLSRDLVSAYNMLPFNDLVRQEPKKYGKYNTAITSGEDIEKNTEKVMEKNGIIKELESKISSKYKSAYFDAYESGDEKTLQNIRDIVTEAFEALDYDQETIDNILDEWDDENVSYSELDKVLSGAIEKEKLPEVMEKVRSAKDDDKIVNHILDKFTSTLEYNRKHNDNRYIEDMVNEALDILGSEGYDAESDKIQKSAQAKSDTLGAVLDNSIDYKKAINDWYSTGKEYKDIRSAITSEYKPQYIAAYEQRDYATTGMLERKIASMYAYIDEKSGKKKTKKSFYDTEVEAIKKWIKKD